MLAKGNRSKAVTDACKEHGGFYLGSIGGPAARLAKDCITKVEVLEYPELGMEAVWKIEVRRLPGVHRRRRQGQRLLRGRVAACVVVAQVLTLPRRVRRRRSGSSSAEERLRRRGERGLRRDREARRRGAPPISATPRPTSRSTTSSRRRSSRRRETRSRASARSACRPPTRTSSTACCSTWRPCSTTSWPIPNEVLEQGSTAFDDINRRLDEYGLTACGSGTDSSLRLDEHHNVYRRDMTAIEDLPELDTFSAEFQAEPARDASGRAGAGSARPRVVRRRDAELRGRADGAPRPSLPRSRWSHPRRAGHHRGRALGQGQQGDPQHRRRGARTPPPLRRPVVHTPHDRAAAGVDALGVHRGARRGARRRRARCRRAGEVVSDRGHLRAARHAPRGLGEVQRLDRRHLQDLPVQRGRRRARHPPRLRRARRLHRRRWSRSGAPSPATTS